MRKCPNCGMDNKSSANFCGSCGARLPMEAPGEIQKSKNGASAVQPAARASGKQKKSWMKAAIPALVLILAVLLFKGISQSHSCPTCNEILDLQKELQAVLAENEDNTLTFDAYERWEMKVSTLSNEMQLLKDHACDMPVRKVKNQKYAYGRYMGSYTGEWKSTAPCGEGVFSGSYMAGATQYVVTYSGEWSGGTPNGTGSMMEHREYLDAGSPENWYSNFYEGTFVSGKLTGSGWTSTESSTGDRFEYFDGVYHDGFLEGQANFLQYKDGELYDQGTVEGSHFVPVYSERQKILNAIETVGAIVVVGVGAKCLYDIIDSAFGDIDPNSGAGKWLEEQRTAIAADMEQWREDKAREESEKQLYNTWQALEGQVKWCETSSYDYDRKYTDYFRDQADEAKKEYDAFRRSSH